MFGTGKLHTVFVLHDGCSLSRNPEANRESVSRRKSCFNSAWNVHVAKFIAAVLGNPQMSLVEVRIVVAMVGSRCRCF